MREKIFRKKADKSLLRDGLTIPKKVWDPLQQELGVNLSKGEAEQIEVMIDQQAYVASFKNIRLSQANEERLQIRYSSQEPIARRLRDKFPYTNHYVEQRWENGKKQVLQTDEYVDIYASGPRRLKFVCVPRNEMDIMQHEALAQVRQYIAGKGFHYPEGMIENLYLCLKSKPFVILAGISGTGKTRLVRLFAEAVGATVENGRVRVVPVRPEWADSAELLGHNDLNGKFVPGQILDFIEAAEEDPAQPYFLCLDEMNLARVEYYFSDILSIIESRSWQTDEDNGKRIVTDPLLTEAYYGRDEQAVKAFGHQVCLPDNLYIIGTVNMDETTFPFSRKVLDRAHTIEFSDIDLMPNFADYEEKQEPQHWSNQFLRAPYLQLMDCRAEQVYVTGLCGKLEELNRILAQGHAQVGYRVRDEFVFYCLLNHQEQLLDENTAFDFCLMQKILPRLQGSETFLQQMLSEFFHFCAGQAELPEMLSAKQMTEYLASSEPRYPRSAAKVAFMAERLENDGFTSFWL